MNDQQYSSFAAGSHVSSEEYFPTNSAAGGNSSCKFATNSAGENRQIAKESQSFDEGEGSACSVALITTPIPTPTPTHTPTPSKRSKTPPSSTYPLKPWRRLWQHEQLAVAFKSAGKQDGYAISLNLSPEREQTLIGHHDPARLLAHYVAREMRAEFGKVLPNAWAFELAPGTGKLHIHGTIIPEDHTPAHRKALKRVLARAAGRVLGKGAARQCSLKRITGAIGWHGYTTKSFEETQRFLRTDRVSYVSRELKQLARMDHSEFMQTAENKSLIRLARRKSMNRLIVH